MKMSEHTRNHKLMLKEIIQAKKSEAGQSMLEMALMLVFLLILLSVIIDIGWLMFGLISLRAASQEGATIASICPDDLITIRERVRNSSSDPVNLGTLPDDQIVVCIIDPDTGACGAAPTLNGQVRVSVTYNQNILNPMIGMVYPANTYPLTTNSISAIIRSSCPDYLRSSP